ncbi:DarT ssDNA thymidine ADP-ribosyltransferase family protein, partial [Providencia sp. SP181]|uniref:DarT ssDNA thymidine ADP-ribosyltransferase family protein n=1 Tax=Providencia sp. SP181 TaxID=3136277 RepID=UPI003D2847A3
KKIVSDRNIKYLCHFTPKSNLDKIMKDGIDLRNIETMEVTDQSRFDGSKNICLTISEPNTWMISNKKKKGFDLALLIIDPKILYEKECLFFPYNAATKSYRNLPAEHFTGAAALERLFDKQITFQKSQQEPQTVYRNGFLKPSITTSNQAEVQVTEKIEAINIMFIINDGDICLNQDQIEEIDKKEKTKRSIELKKLSDDIKKRNEKRRADQEEVESRRKEISKMESKSFDIEQFMKEIEDLEKNHQKYKYQPTPIRKTNNSKPTTDFISAGKKQGSNNSGSDSNTFGVVFFIILVILWFLFK